jgi:Zn-dependent protease/CBS domain-containing protein
MRATLRLGRIRGIDLGAHWSVLVIGALLAFGLSGGVVDGVLWAVVVPTVLLFLGSLLAHELGHSLVAQRAGMRVRGITLWVLGGVAQLEGRMPTAGAQFRIAAAGPAVSYLLAVGFFGLSVLGGAAGAPAIVGQALAWLGFVNVVLGTFNLIPAAPLDGGRILASAVWAATGNRTRAEVVATRVGQGFGVALIALGVLGSFVEVPYVSLWTALMGIFVYRTATTELAHARFEGAFGDRRVGDVMTRAPETIRGWMTVQAYADEVTVEPARHRAFPVVTWEGTLAGVVTLDRLARVPMEQRASIRVQDVAIPISMVGTATPEEPLVATAGRYGMGQLGLILVFEETRLVGIVTGSDLERVNDPTPAVPTVVGTVV